MSQAPPASQRKTPSVSAPGIEQLAINTIRTLAMDAVAGGQERASRARRWPWRPWPMRCGTNVLRYDPADPAWPNRDRFVLSCGHASMLLYSMLHLAGREAVGSSDGKPTGRAGGAAGRDQASSANCTAACPGHPEHVDTTGVETTTGPLGQGCGNSVGMAIAQRWLAAHFNRPGFELFDYNIYAMCSDGDLMEGVGREAASLAGHLKLVEPVLDLRRQPHHDRRAHRAGL